VFAEAVRVQAVLEGVRLPAKRRELMTYAAAQPGGAQVEGLLSTLPDREYRSLDEVGEALAPVHALVAEPDRLPREESGAPPGGDDYTSPSPEPGAVQAG
jgi:hypothetical protein